VFPGYTFLGNVSLDRLCRNEIEGRLARLKRLREVQAAGLGVLCSEGMEFVKRGGNWREEVVLGVNMMRDTMKWLISVDVTERSTEDVEAGTSIMGR
jgi:hypothetical protein